jgi:predicted RecB family nuclease
MADPLTKNKGFRDITAEKLRKAGFTTIVALAVTQVRDIKDRTGLEYKPALSLVERAREMTMVNYVTEQELKKPPFQTDRFARVSSMFQWRPSALNNDNFPHIPIHIGNIVLSGLNPKRITEEKRMNNDG